MTRRKLKFETLPETVEEAQGLLASGYVRNGNWSLGQACRHIRLTVDASIDGYPWWMAIGWPLRPLLRRLFMPKLLRGDSPAGIRTAGVFVPPEDLDDADEVAKYSACVERFIKHEGDMHPHPGFGRMRKPDLELFHAMHMAHHLGFLSPSDEQEQAVNS